MLQIALRCCATILFFCALGALQPPDAHAQQKSAEDLFKEGNEYFQAGLYRKAIRTYKESVALNPDFKEAWYNLGVAYGRQKVFKQESASYERAISLDPKYGRAVFNLAVAHEDNGNLPGAIKAYEEFLALAGGEKDQADAHVNVGILYSKTGRHEEAIEAYDKAIVLDPDLADANFNLALNYGKMAALEKYKGQHKELRQKEIDAYVLATKQRPNHHKAWYNLAVTYNKTGNIAAEIDAYENAIRIKARYPQALFNLAYAYEEKGKTTDAIETWQKYLDIAKDIPKEKGFLDKANQELTRLTAEPNQSETR